MLDVRPVFEGEGFKELMHSPEPGYTEPQRGTVIAKYSSTKEFDWSPWIIIFLCEEMEANITN